ncbi:glutamate--tRNA ligase [Candidatus Dependentiae bacterium]|nr:glutamate--tRNA ligase [Candidatus Dependentiae bacterium]
MKKEVRVRFAPSPTGLMHLGNIRTALMNYLFAKQKKGKFVVRIEDTDQRRNLDEASYAILDDLEWLNLKYDEGPGINSKYSPYFQSKRTEIYKKYLDDLIYNEKVYRCFCTPQKLEEKRQRQLSEGKPPKYDRECLNLSDDQIKAKITQDISFVWRLKLNEDQIFEIQDMARGKIAFEMKHFSDFALTRNDGSFTFMFSNFIDDWLMQITHVIRGEDHLSNTAMQAALFNAFAVNLPVFWHLPMICNQQGKKLSKRDFGFSLDDLRNEGFLPQAICNYLAIIGSSFTQEIQSLEELILNLDFENINSTGSIRFDFEKLNWINHKWIEKIPIGELLGYVKLFLYKQIPDSENLIDEKLEYILKILKTDLKTLKDIGKVLKFYFISPKTTKADIEKEIGQDEAGIIIDLIQKNINLIEKPNYFLEKLKKEGKQLGLKNKEIFGPIRYLLTGKFQGPSIHSIMEILENKDIEKRLNLM